MRVNITYSVKEEDLLPELGKLVTNLKEDLEQCVVLYNNLPAQLQQGEPGLDTALEMLREFKEGLKTVDIRLNEVEGFLENVRHRRTNPGGPK